MHILAATVDGIFSTGINKYQSFSKINISHVLRKIILENSIVNKQNNSLNLDFPDDSFDVITCFEFLEHIDQHEEFMSEIKSCNFPVHE